MNRELNEREISLVFALLVFNGRATTDQLVDFLKISKGYLVNILTSLRKKDIIASFRVSEAKTSVIFGSPSFNFHTLETLNPKERIHFLKLDLPELLKRYPETLRWAKITLGIKSQQELEEHLKRVRQKRIKEFQ